VACPDDRSSRPGPGVDNFDSLSALEQWREKDTAPPQIMAKNRETRMARPLCPYLQAAEYKGSGDLKDAANCRCAAPK
jgi:feruloyl esterase